MLYIGTKNSKSNKKIQPLNLIYYLEIDFEIISKEEQKREAKLPTSAKIGGLRVALFPHRLIQEDGGTR